MKFTYRMSLFLLVVLSSAACGLAAEDDAKTIADPENTGVTYELQGEYAGDLGRSGEEKQTWGAQVVARGDGKFHIVAYQGGLPGDGWARGDTRMEFEGQRKDQQVHASGEKAKLLIKAGKIHVTFEGNDVGAMEKVDRQSPTLGAEAPEKATVLFGGETAEHFQGGEIVQDDLLLAGCESKQKFGDHKLHLEFRTPFKPHARGQARGNSGVYIQGRYELQVLDSFGLKGRDNECGGIYSIAEPIVNMCFPPLTWQTYDIDFTAARYEGGEKTENARVTIKHNGVIIHENLELPHHTPGKIAEGPGPGPLYLQGHGNPVVYRNIWVVEK